MNNLMVIIEELDNAAIRKTDDGRYSVYDFIGILGAKNPRTTFERLVAVYPEYKVVTKPDAMKIDSVTKPDAMKIDSVTKPDAMKIEGYKFKRSDGKVQAQETPVTGKQGILELLGILPGKMGKAYREYAANLVLRYIKADAAIALSIAERTPEPEKLQPVADVVVERSTDVEWLEQHYESTGKRLSFVRGVDVFVSPGLHPEQDYLQFLLSERFGLKPAPIAFVQTLEGGDEAFDQYLADRQPQIHKDLHTNQANTEEWDGLHGYFFKDAEQWASERCGAFKF
jgi:hypothetical protein